ncbi:MAG: DUF6383 domain-containing protein [Paludibacter sp.]|nr:DUF6383 domain-containing protein [Paludibacter sp.]
MKKITLLMVAIAATMISVSAQTTVVFNETCGEGAPTTGTRPSVAAWEGWDNFGVVTFSYTTERYPDVRATSTINSHVWFPANFDADLIISGIAAADYQNMKLSFDLATNAGSSNLPTNVNKIIVEVNDAAVTVPSVAITNGNTYVSSGEIAIPDAATIKLRFFFTAANNPTNFGYRLDNIKITGENTSIVETIDNNSIEIYSNNGNIVVDNAQAGQQIAVYNVAGQMLVNRVAKEGTNTISAAGQGILIVRCGEKVGKIIL